MKILLIAALMLSSMAFAKTNAKVDLKKVNDEFVQFLKGYEAKIIPLSKDTNTAAYAASVTGKDSDYKKSEDLQLLVTKIYTNKNDFATLKRIRDSKAIKDPALKRQLDIIFLAYQSNQADPKKIEDLVKRQTEIEKKFSTYRAEVNGNKLSDNQIEDILATSKDSKELESAWLAHKKIGPFVAADILALIKERNEIAKEIGFKNFHEMSLKLSEQDPQEIERLFDELDQLTRKAFARLKDEIDTTLSKQLKITKSEMRPWHYQNRYFQAAPRITSVDFDVFYKKQDVIELAKTFFDGIGLSVDDILARSDLYEKPGKNQHAYSNTIDRDGDVRVFLNVKPNEDWMNTTLHELGHASYSKAYSRQDLPWTLRDDAHIFTTEAIAMLMGRLSKNPTWMKGMLNLKDDDVKKIKDDSFKMLRTEQLVFSRWAQVMYRFEKAMYANPDQDLNKLWWDLVEKYQMVRRPDGRNEPDWATKIHIATAPCYYHNYLLGELLASQINHHIVKTILKSNDTKAPNYVGNRAIGDYLRNNIFMVGRSLEWNDMIEKATGEKLTAKYYALQFIK